MLNKDIYPQLKPSKTDFTQRFIILVCIATMALLISGCVTLPSPEGSADPQFFSSGVRLDAGESIKVVATDPRNGKVFVGGRFSSLGNVMYGPGLPIQNIAMYDPVRNQFYALSLGGLSSASGTPEVLCLAFLGKYLYVGGRFSGTAYLGAGEPVVGLNNVARYDIETGQWSSLSHEGINGTVQSLAVNGNDLYVGGEFLGTHDGNVLGQGILRYNTGTANWSPLNGSVKNVGGLNGPVITMAVFAGDVFAGGSFESTLGDAPLSVGHIVRYKPLTDTWEQLTDNGLNGTVWSITATSAGIYVGGPFSGTQEGMTTLNRVAFYDSVGWFPFPEGGLNGPVTSISLFDGDVYVGGDFETTADGKTTLNRIARLHNNQWSALVGNGLNGTVNAITGGTDSLYIAGSFDQTADISASVTGMNAFARYGPPASPLAENLGTGTTGFIPFNGGIGLNGEVRAIESGPGGMLYVGGDFTQSFDGTVGLGKIARFNPIAKKWTALDMGGLNGVVNALAVDGNTLYVGGEFSTTAQSGGPVLRCIAKYDLTTNTWSAMENNGLDSEVRAMKIIGDNLYVGGSFGQTVSPVVTNLNLIARYNLTTPAWHPMGNNGLAFGVVEALGAHGTDLIVGGYFTATADYAVSDIYYIARYDTTIPGPNPSPWSPMANGGLSFLSNVFAIDGDKMMVRGGFLQTRDGTITLNGLGVYNFGTTSNQDTWSPVAGDPDSRALIMQTNASRRVGNDMYIGGTFTSVGGRVALYFTRVYLNQWGGLAPLALSTDWFAGANWTTGSPPPANTSVVIPAGTGPIDISSGDVILDDLMLNGGTISVGAGRTLTINGTLSLSGGKINGPGSVVVTSCKPEAVMFGDNASYVETALTRCVNDLGAYNFDVGTANAYSPVTIKNVTGTGNVSVKPNQGAYSAPAMTLPATRLARWWTIENPGGGITNADIFFNYPQADIAGNEYGYRAYRIAGGNASVMPGSINWFSNIATAPNVTGFSDWTLAEFAPSAATVSVAGRVTTANGAGISKAIVTFTDQNGNVRRILTGSFGYYRFDDVAAGQTCVLSVGNKRHLFAEPTRVVTISDDALEIDFVALP